MKRVWETDERLEHWALTQQEREFAAKAKTETITLGFALLLTWFQYEGRFRPRRMEVPTVVRPGSTRAGPS